ncbi:MAG: GntR family transcriptional regulator [Sedimentisphaeraceae bacterium JB056]
MVNLSDFVVDKESYSAVSSQLGKYLKQGVLSGRFKPGEKLPPTRHIASQIGVGAQTVSEAFCSLKSEGLIEVTKRGTFVNPKLEHLGNGATLISDGITASSTKTFAFIYSNSSLYQYSALFEGACQYASKSIPSLSLEVMNTFENSDKQASAFLNVLHKKFSGVVVTPPLDDTAPAFHYQVLQDAGIPVVFCYRGVEGVQAPVVTLDWEKVGRLAAKEMLNAGHKRIGYIASMKYSVSLGIQKGIQDELAKEGMELDERNIIYNQTDIHNPVAQGQEMMSQIDELLSRKDRPTVIFSQDTRLETILLLSAQKMGLRIPEDLSLIQYGFKHPDCMMLRRISSIGCDLSDLGAKTVEILGEILSGKRNITDSERVMIDLVFDSGETITSPN